MLGTIVRAVQVKKLESRKRRLETQRDRILRALDHGGDAPLFRHEYPNTPVLEDVFLELDYLHEALAGHGVHVTEDRL